MSKADLLPSEVRMYILQRVACYDSPMQVVRAVKEQFDGLEIRRQLVEYYDPTRAYGEKLGPDLKELFYAERKKFLAEVAGIGITHKAMRLRRLERYLNTLEDRNNLIAAAAILEQAAKECGDAFTNTRVHTGPGGGPMQAELTHRTDRELAEVIAQLFAKVMIEDEGAIPVAPEALPSA